MFLGVLYFFFFFYLFPRSSVWFKATHILVHQSFFLVSAFHITPRSCAVPCCKHSSGFAFAFHFTAMYMGMLQTNCIYYIMNHLIEYLFLVLIWLALQYSLIRMCSETSPGCHRPADSSGCSTVVHSLATGQTNKQRNFKLEFGRNVLLLVGCYLKRVVVHVCTCRPVDL